MHSLEMAEIGRAFGVAGDMLLVEIAHADAGLASRLAEPLRALTAA